MIKVLGPLFCMEKCIGWGKWEIYLSRGLLSKYRFPIPFTPCIIFNAGKIGTQEKMFYSGFCSFWYWQIDIKLHMIITICCYGSKNNILKPRFQFCFFLSAEGSWSASSWQAHQLLDHSWPPHSLSLQCW